MIVHEVIVFQDRMDLQSMLFVDCYADVKPLWTYAYVDMHVHVLCVYVLVPFVQMQIPNYNARLLSHSEDH